MLGTVAKMVHGWRHAYRAYFHVYRPIQKHCGLGGGEAVYTWDGVWYVEKTKARAIWQDGCHKEGDEENQMANCNIIIGENLGPHCVTERSFTLIHVITDALIPTLHSMETSMPKPGAPAIEGRQPPGHVRLPPKADT